MSDVAPGAGGVLSYVEARLAYELDVVAAHAAQAEGSVTIVDTRKQLSWDHGHVAGALHLGVDVLPRDSVLVLYGWGPGCNGATHTALALLRDGYDVREMVGGYEYWVRNGFPTEGVAGPGRAVPDPLVTAEG